jgi:hypothetical protein
MRIVYQDRKIAARTGTFSILPFTPPHSESFRPSAPGLFPSAFGAADNRKRVIYRNHPGNLRRTGTAISEKHASNLTESGDSSIRNACTSRS